MTQQKPGSFPQDAVGWGPYKEKPAQPGRSTRAQRSLITLTMLLAVAGLVTIVASMVVYGLIVLIMAGLLLLTFLKGAGVGQRVMNIGILRRKRQQDSPQQQRQPSVPRGYGGRQESPRHAPPELTAGAGPRELERRKLGPADPVSAGLAPVIAPPVPPGPPAFGLSTAGQSPWHLPASPSAAGLAADAALLGDLEVRAASVVGPGHRCEEPADPRQDAYALGRTPDGQYLVIAVADGVSQSRHADLGARVAVSTATRELVKMLAIGGIPAIRTEWLYKAIAGEMTGTARSRGVTEQDVCSILITVVIPAAPRGDGTRVMWASWIGDVSLWLQRGGILHRLTGQEKSGLDRNELSAVLPFNPNLVQELPVLLHPDDRVAVMTDGLSDSMQSISGVTEYFTRQWAGLPPHPASFLQDLCYDAPGQSDDRTVVVAWCGADAPPLPNDARSGWHG